jgi:hypothetical protein
MSLIEWIDLFDDIFESYPDKWTLTSVHRDNTGQCSELLSQRRMERTGYARYIILDFFRDNFLVFL